MDNPAVSHEIDMSTQVLNMKFSDADEFCAAPTGWDIDFRQIDKGALSIGLDLHQTRGMLIASMNFSRQFHQRGSAPKGALTFGLPAHDKLHSWMRKPVDRPALLNFSRMAEYDSVSRPNFTGHTICLDETFYRDVAQSIGLDVSVDQIRRDWHQIGGQ